MVMTHGSLFSGIGGFDLAARWVGWVNLFNCDIDPFCRTILKYHFPDAQQYDDIRSVDFTVWRGRVNVLSGGFPCQPFSSVGDRKGTEDSRYLWPEMLRAIREIHPDWVVGENVLGIVNWSGGLVFEQVCSDLEAEGYEVQPFILPACGVGAPHQRYRTWFVACCSDARAENVQQERAHGVHAVKPLTYTGSQQLQKRTPYSVAANQSEDRTRMDDWAKRHGDVRVTSDAGGLELQGCKQHRGIKGSGTLQGQSGQFSGSVCGQWDEFPAQSPICSRDDGFPISMDGITVSKWRRESIKAYGNAIVPQVAFQIFQVISEMSGDAV